MPAELPQIPNFDDVPHRAPSTKHNRSRNGGPTRPRIPSREECYAQIHSLNGLVAMGILAPSRANSIRANLLAIIAYHDRASSSSGEVLSDSTIRQIWQVDPGLLNHIEHLMTEEQLEKALREATGNDDRQA
jgi:hypothetical protein